MGRKKIRYRITCTRAEWAALCICANHGASEMVASASPRHRETVEQMVRYADQAVKVIHDALPTQVGAPLRHPDPSADASDDTLAAAPPRESPAPLDDGLGT